jgi:ABC-type Fe3+-citrate transport system substrate-binding protein
MTRLVFLFAMILLVSCGTEEKKFDNQTYENVKESLEEKEKKNPKQFLVVSSTDKKNFIGQKVIRITVKNNASVCTYKDVTVRIGFYSETGTRLEEDEETIYKSISPNSSINYKTKFFAPRGTDDVKVTIVDAKVVTE